jgi:hypothetical protein
MTGSGGAGVFIRSDESNNQTQARKLFIHHASNPHCCEKTEGNLQLIDTRAVRFANAKRLFLLKSVAAHDVQRKFIMKKFLNKIITPVAVVAALVAIHSQPSLYAQTSGSQFAPSPPGGPVPRMPNQPQAPKTAQPGTQNPQFVASPPGGPIPPMTNQSPVPIPSAQPAQGSQFAPSPPGGPIPPHRLPPMTNGVPTGQKPLPPMSFTNRATINNGINSTQSVNSSAINPDNPALRMSPRTTPNNPAIRVVPPSGAAPVALPPVRPTTPVRPATVPPK